MILKKIYTLAVKAGLGYSHWIVVITVLSLALLVGCSNAVQDRSYRNASAVAPLQIPDGLSLTPGKDTLEVPDIQATQTMSDDELELPPTLSQAPPVVEQPPEKSETDEETDKSPKATVTVQYLQDEEGMPYLVVDGKAQDLWPSVGSWVDKLGFEVKDKNIANLSYDIYKKLPAASLDEKKLLPGEQGKPDSYEQYEIYLVESQNRQSQVRLRDREGREEGSALAKHLLLQIKSHLEGRK